MTLSYSDTQPAAAASGEARLYVSVEEAARLLGISRTLAFVAVRSGQIPSVRIGRRVLVPRSRLLELAADSGR